MIRSPARWLGATGVLVLAAQASASLLLHLPFDHNADDASGAGHHARASGEARVSPNGSQLGDGAATLSGESNTFFNVPVYTPVVEDRPRTASLWLRTTNVFRRTPNVILLGWGDPGAMRGVRYDLGLENGDPSRLRLEFNVGFVVSDPLPQNLADGDWHHLLVGCDGTNAWFAVDGKAQGGVVPLPLPLRTGFSTAGTVIGAGVREATGQGLASRHFAGEIDDVAIWDTALTPTDAALVHGLGKVGNNDARWLEAARELAGQAPGSSARISGWTWRKVQGLTGQPGDWQQIGGPNGAGSFIVLDSLGGGIRLEPQVWEYAGVQLTALLMAVAAGALILLWSADRLRLRLRLRRMETQELMEGERRRIAQDLHDDLGSSLTEIMQLGDLAAKEDLSPEQLRSRLAGITSKTREMIAAVDEIVWTANPVNDVLPRLAEYLADHAQHFIQAKGLACRLDVMDGLPPAPVSARTRHHVLLAVKEALNNSVKYSGATEIRLHIRCQGSDLHLSVEDNGRGFDPATVRPGNGLGNMRSRMTELGGQTHIESQTGQGTRVRFQVPLPKPTS